MPAPIPTAPRVHLAGLLPVLLLLTLPLGAQTNLRIASYNVQDLGSIGGSQWNAAVAVLDRVDADIVALQEVNDSEAGVLATFASALGYAHHAVSARPGPLGGPLRTGFLSRFPLISTTSHTATSLSGDGNANDIGRLIFEAQVQLPNQSQPFAVYSLHYKASSGSTNDFRRLIEITRTRQAVDRFLAANPGAPVAICGDFNEDLGDGPFGNVFNSLPSGLPSSFRLGNDISLPLTYLPFGRLLGANGTLADATQEDSTSIDTTRPASGRRLDYIVHEGPVVNLGDEVYASSRDNGFDDPPLGNWLPKSGGALSSPVSLDASDHLVVFADLRVGSTPPPPPPPAATAIPGTLVISEWLATPAAGFDPLAEWIELRNVTGDSLDVQGYTIRDAGSDSFTLPALTIPPRGHLLLGAVGAQTLNGGITPDFVWPGGSMTLAPGGDAIEVVAPDGTVVDAVTYGLQPSGAAIERRDPTATAVGSNFTTATTPFGAGDLGTPGALNAADVGPIFTTLDVAGLQTPGSTAFLTVGAPFSLAGRTYLLGAAAAPAPGVPLGGSGRVVPLAVDDLLLFSAAPNNGVFIDFSGQISGFGFANARIAIPPLPALSGTTIYLSGVIIDPTAIEWVASIIDPFALTIR